MSSRASLLFVSLLAGASLSSNFASAETIGSSISIAHLVTAQLATDTRTLAGGDAINQNELIEVSADGSGEFKLLDNTKLALGPGARLMLDKFVYDPAKTGNSIALRFMKGAFRFVTGLAEKPAYVIHVPSASITVRGTIFDVFVEDNGTSWLLLHEGGVRVCNAIGTCRDHSEVGKLIRVSDGGELTKPTRWTSLPGVEKISFDSAFPFVVTPPYVDPKPVLTREAVLKTTSDTVDEAPKPKRRAEAPKKKVLQVADNDDQDSSSMKKAQQAKAAQAKKAQQAKAAKEKAKAQADAKAKKEKWYAKDRDRGLDVASEYSPKGIDKVRKGKYIEKGDSVNTGNGKKGWQQYMDKYYSR